MGFTRFINSHIDTLLLSVMRSLRVAPERLHIEGTIRICDVPFLETLEDYRHWWVPEVDGTGRIIRPARISPREKERYIAAEFRNLLSTAGRNLLMQYLSSSANTTPPFAQFFAVGQGALVQVQAADTGLAVELARSAVSAAVVLGTQIDVQTAFTGGAGAGTWTNAGLFGKGASSVSGSGTLTTHALTNFVKGSTTVTVDYILNIW